MKLIKIDSEPTRSELSMEFVAKANVKELSVAIPTFYTIAAVFTSIYNGSSRTNSIASSITNPCESL